MKTHVALLAVLALWSPGCATWEARYVNSRENPENSIRRDGPVPVAVVEFSELGSYHDPTQIEKTEKLIQAATRPLVVTYIHGWHHYADSRDRDKFRDFLERLAETRIVKNKFDVVGVYLAWNGESWSTPWINSLSIWDRKAAAERLANNGDCLDTLLRIGLATRTGKGSAHYNFYIGHSLGGLILERAIAHTFLSARYSGADKLPWDLAVMLNSAADAVLTRQLMAGLHNRYELKGDQFKPRNGDGVPIQEDRPTIISLTAKNDLATGKLFPAGAAIAEAGHWRWPKVNPPGADKPVSELKFHRTTPGNNRFLVNFYTKDISKDPSPVTHPPDRATAFDANLAHDIRQRTFWTSAPQNYPTEAQRKNRKGEVKAPPQDWKTWQFVPVTGSENLPGGPWMGPRVPYWDVRVDETIIDNHGGIWSENTMAMLAAIFRMHVPLKSQDNPPKAIQRSSTTLPVPVETQRMLREVRPD